MKNRIRYRITFISYMKTFRLQKIQYVLLKTKIITSVCYRTQVWMNSSDNETLFTTLHTLQETSYVSTVLILRDNTLWFTLSLLFAYESGETSLCPSILHQSFLTKFVNNYTCTQCQLPDCLVLIWRHFQVTSLLPRKFIQVLLTLISTAVSSVHT